MTAKRWAAAALLALCGLPFAAGQAHAGEVDLCPLLQEDLRLALHAVGEFHKNFRRAQKEWVAAMQATDRNSLERKKWEELLDRTSDTYWESLRELETVLVVRRELGCPPVAEKKG